MIAKPGISNKFKLIIAQLGKDAKILDLGCEQCNLADRIIRADINPEIKPDVVCDADKLPFEAEYFDAVICTVLLEHVENPEQVVQEKHRVLKYGGKICVEIPFPQGFHADPEDFRRFTIMGIEKLFAIFEKIE